LKLSGFYSVDLADEVAYQDVRVVVPYDTPQQIQLPSVGIRAVEVIGIMAEAPQTPVTLFVVSRGESSGQSANGRVSGLFNARSLQIEITAHR